MNEKELIGEFGKLDDNENDLTICKRIEYRYHI